MVYSNIEPEPKPKKNATQLSLDFVAFLFLPLQELMQHAASVEGDSV